MQHLYILILYIFQLKLFKLLRESHIHCKSRTASNQVLWKWHFVPECLPILQKVRPIHQFFIETLSKIYVPFKSTTSWLHVCITLNSTEVFWVRNNYNWIWRENQTVQWIPLYVQCYYYKHNINFTPKN